MDEVEIKERFEKLEGNYDDIKDKYNDLNTSVKLLTQAMNNNTKTTEKLTLYMEEQKKKPSDWINSGICAFIGILIGKFFN